MSRTAKWALIVAIGAWTAGCGGSKSSQDKAAAESMEKAAQQAQSGAEQMGKALESLAGGLSGANPNQQPVEPVDFRQLQSLLPESLSGWERGKPSGEKMTQPVNYSEASVNFTKGDASLSVKITDTSFNQLILAPFSMMLATGYSKETSDGYEKSVKVGGEPGFAKWDDADKDGEITVVVNKRFLVQIEGRGLSDDKALTQIANAMNLKKLAELK